MGNEGKLGPLLVKFWGRMHDPIQLRAVLCGSLLLTWYFAAFGPLSGEIEETSRAMAREKKHLELARDVESLRAQVKRFQGRLPESSDPNEWVKYVLTSLRKYPVKLVALDPQPPRKHGPFNLMVLRIELEGAFPDLDRFLGWLETNERLIRIESVRIEPHRSGNGVLVMQLMVLGVMG